MVVDVDANENGEHCIFQVSDDRFYLVFWAKKSQLAKTRKAIAALDVDEEGVLGEISSGERVWICRDKRAYWIAIGDTDSKDICYKISKAEFKRLIEAEPK
jgi:hypothetical protein